MKNKSKNKPLDFSTSMTVYKDLMKEAKLVTPLHSYMDKKYITRKDKSYYVDETDVINGVIQTLPDSEMATILNSKTGQVNDRQRYGLALGLNLFGSLCAFRHSPIIYQLDAEYIEEIKPISLDTPLDIFNKIPHISFYVNYPIMQYEGFLITKCKLSHKNKIGLKIIFFTRNQSSDFTRKHLPLIHPLTVFVPTKFLPLEAGDIPNTEKQPVTVGDFVEHIRTMQTRQRNTLTDPDFKFTEKEDNAEEVVLKMLSILLWFAVQAPDISDFTGKQLSISELQRSYSTKDKSGRLVAPSTPILRIIGNQLGGEIRKFKDRIADEQACNNNPNRTVKPHIRCGHWHGFWSGTVGNKEYNVKWLNATLVNAKHMTI